MQSDVLVIGGGLAGGWAAIAAARAGASVILVDKGYFGTSGVTATAGPGHWWVPPDPAEARAEAVRQRNVRAFGLGDPAWMERIIDLTWRTLPTLAPYYAFSKDEHGATQYRGLRGPEYLAALRRLALDLGVRILDQSPAPALPSPARTIARPVSSASSTVRSTPSSSAPIAKPWRAGRPPRWRPRVCWVNIAATPAGESGRLTRATPMSTGEWSRSLPERDPRPFRNRPGRPCVCLPGYGAPPIAAYTE